MFVLAMIALRLIEDSVRWLLLLFRSTDTVRRSAEGGVKW
jgi:hypothetical protein